MDLLNLGDLAPTRVPVRYRDEDYFLCEMSPADLAAYEDRRSSCCRYNDEGRLTHYEGLGQIEPFVVSLCLKRPAIGTDSSAGFAPVSERDILERVDDRGLPFWTGKAVRKLYDKAMEINDLDEGGLDFWQRQLKLAQDKIKRISAREGVLKNGSTAGAESSASPASTS